MKELPVRKNIRLKGYDYSQAGYYFITVCVKDGHEILWENDGIVGAIINRPQNSDTGKSYIELSEYGIIVNEAIDNIAINYKNVIVDKYVIMPNHVHLILILCHFGDNGRLIIAPTNISTIVQQFKRHITKQIGFSLWQKSFHDHIIRDKEDYQRICQYIDENPQKWTNDCYFVERK